MDHRRSTIPFLITLALLAAILGHFLYHMPLPLGAMLSEIANQFGAAWEFPVHAAMGLLTVFVMWFAAAGLGFLILSRAGGLAEFPSLWQRYVFAVLTGWVVLGLSVLAVGLAGFCSRVGLGVLLIVASAFGVLGWRALFTGMREAGGRRAVEESQTPGWLLAFVFLLLLVAVPYALTPAVESDELRYHLAAPESYLETGQITYLPHQAFSNFPFLIEMLFTMALALQGAEAAKTVHLSFLETSAILTALLAFLLIRSATSRASSRSSSAVAIAAVTGTCAAAIPSATILAAWGFVDIATLAYFLAVAYLGGLALSRRRLPPPWLLGMMAAGAIGTKYLMVPMMLGAVGLLAILLAQNAKANAPSRFRYLLRACAVAAIFAAPWFIKNLIWTHNPVYPLAYSVFGGGDWSQANAEFYSAKAAEKGFRLSEFEPPEGFKIPSMPVSAQRLIEFALSPVTTSLLPDRFEQHFLGPLPLMAMALAAAGFVISSFRKSTPRGHPKPWRCPLALWIAGLTVISWTLWFFTYQSNRMLFPSLALIFAAGAVGAVLLIERMTDATARRRAWGPLAVVVGAALLYSWGFTTKIIAYSKRPHPIPVALGFGSREAYLTDALAYYPTARWLSTRLTPERRALLIGEHRTLYFGKEIVASDWFDTPQPLPFIRETQSTDELLDRLLALKIHYIYYNQDELKQYAARYFVPRFTKEEYERFQELIKSPRLKPLHQDPRREIMIYEISGERDFRRE